MSGSHLFYSFHFENFQAGDFLVGKDIRATFLLSCRNVLQQKDSQSG